MPCPLCSRGVFLLDNFILGLWLTQAFCNIFELWLTQAFCKRCLFPRDVCFMFELCLTQAFFKRCVFLEQLNFSVVVVFSLCLFAFCFMIEGFYPTFVHRASYKRDEEWEENK